MKPETRAFLKRSPAENMRLVAEGYFARLPRLWQSQAREKYAELSKASIVEAMRWLGGLVAPLSEKIDIAANDDDLKMLADECAFRCRSFFADSLDGFLRGTKLANGLRCCHELCVFYGVRLPLEFDQNQQRARLVDEVWWLRNLRNSHAKAREHAAIGADKVHARGEVYCSDDTLDRRGQQLRRNAQLMADIELVSQESGEVISLQAAAAAGMANQENRRNELMTRIRGFEELAARRGDVCTFVTATCPARMHAMLHNGKRNPKYDGTTPDKAQKYLTECWARVRAAWARVGVRVYGLRVSEPHHDGTPHWHMVLFHGGGFAETALRSYITAYFLADNGNEPGAAENRVKFVRINPAKGTATGYVMKYVAKNIGGIHGEESDEAEASSESLAARVEAWASTWRIRQFQQIGGHFVTIWRELRRVDGFAAAAAGHAVFCAWQAAQRRGEVKASYAAFIEALGGLDVSPHEGAVALLVVYEDIAGRYGDTVRRFHRGVRERFGVRVAINDREHWQRV